MKTKQQILKLWLSAYNLKKSRAEGMQSYYTLTGKQKAYETVLEMSDLQIKKKLGIL